MTGWIRDVDKAYISQEVQLLIDENEILRSKITLLENKILLLQAQIDELSKSKLTL